MLGHFHERRDLDIVSGILSGAIDHLDLGLDIVPFEDYLGVLHVRLVHADPLSCLSELPFGAEHQTRFLQQLDLPVTDRDRYTEQVAQFIDIFWLSHRRQKYLSTMFFGE